VPRAPPSPLRRCLVWVNTRAQAHFAKPILEALGGFAMMPHDHFIFTKTKGGVLKTLLWCVRTTARSAADAAQACGCARAWSAPAA
jgi:hypothetical protein